MISWLRRPPLFRDETARYLASAEFQQLAKDTRTKHIRLCRILDDRFGHLRVDKIGTRDVEDMRSDLVATPGNANNLLSLLRRILAPGLRDGYILRNPTDGVRLLRLGKIHTWTEAEIARFEDRWPRGGAQILVYREKQGRRGSLRISGAMIRLIFDLYIWTDQRRADVNKLMWSDIFGGRVFVKQQKTGTELSLPFHAELQRATAPFPRGNGRIITTPTGRNYTLNQLTYMMAAAIKAAGLPRRCTPHGLRKATLRRIAEAKGTVHQLKGVGGHKDLRELAVYTEAADQQLLSDEAFDLIVPKQRPQGP